MSEIQSFQPPRHMQETSFLYCPVCGKDDRYASIGSNYHWFRGHKCEGTPLKLVYRFDRVAP